MDLLTVDRFEWGFFLIALVFTILPFLWVRKRPLREKIYILPFILFFFVYSGIGAAWEGCDKDYLFFYFLWMCFFSFTLYFTMGGKAGYPTDGFETERTSFIIRNAKLFIIAYFLIKLVVLAQAGKILNLISPPSIDIRAALEAGEDAADGGLFYYLEKITFIFYFTSLYKYRTKIGKLFFLVFFPFYIDYSSSGYVARSTVMAFLIIYFIAIYYFNPERRKSLRLIFFAGLPFLVIGLSLYTFIRMGMEVDRSVGDAVTLLAYQETSYPIHFSLIKKLTDSWDLFVDYLHWLITLPFPGFMKDSSKDYFFNAIFTEKLYGIIRGTQGFYILLPGVVNEGIFIFGKVLFPLHAIVLGLFVSLAYRVVKYKEEFFLFLYISYFLASLIARAGTVSTYPVYLKDLLMYEMAILLVHSVKTTKIKRV